MGHLGSSANMGQGCLCFCSRLLSRLCLAPLELPLAHGWLLTEQQMRVSRNSHHRAG